MPAYSEDRLAKLKTSTSWRPGASNLRYGYVRAD